MHFIRSLYKFIVVLVFIGIWEIASRLSIVNPLFIPPFSEVMNTLWTLLLKGNLIHHISISVFRAIFGFAIAIIIGIPFGLVMGGWFKRMELVLEPLMEIFSQTNPFVLFHIVILFLGIGEAPKIVIIGWACLWPIVFNTMGGIRNVNPLLMKAARTFALGRVSMFFKVVLPATAPSIFVGLRLSAGYSLFMLIAAEMMGSSSGLGWLIIRSQENYEIRKIFAAVIVIAFIGLLLDIFIQLIEKKFFITDSQEVLNSAEN